MKLAVVLLTIAFSTLVLSSIMHGQIRTPNPNDIFRKVQFRPLRPLDYAGIFLPIKNLKLKSILFLSTKDIIESHTINLCCFIPVTQSSLSIDADTLTLDSLDSTPFLSRLMDKSKTQRLP